MTFASCVRDAMQSDENWVSSPCKVITPPPPRRHDFNYICPKSTENGTRILDSHMNPFGLSRMSISNNTIYDYDRTSSNHNTDQFII